MRNRPRNSKEILDNIGYGVRRGVAQALANHKKEGHSIAVWQDGKVVLIPPQEIEIPDEFRDIVEKK